MRRRLGTGLLALCALAGTATAQFGTPRLLKDVHGTDLGSTPAGFTVVNGWCYFTAVPNGSDGRRTGLYRFDGQGTVEQLEPPAGSPATGSISELIPVGSKLFYGTGSSTSSTLNCLETTTLQLTRIPMPLEAKGVFRDRAFALDGKLFFQTALLNHPTELWISDGTVSGTWSIQQQRPQLTRLTEILGVTHAGPGGSIVGWFLVNIWTVPRRHDLWTTDGTPAGTRFVRSLPPGESIFGDLGEDANGRPVFLTEGSSGMTMWSAEITPDRLRSIGQLDPPPYSRAVWTRPLDGLVYFMGGAGSQGPARVTDGVTWHDLTMPGWAGVPVELGETPEALWLLQDGTGLIRVDRGTRQAVAVGVDITPPAFGRARVGDRFFYSDPSYRALHEVDVRTGTERQLFEGGVQEPIGFGHLVVMRHNDGLSGSEPWAWDTTREELFQIANLRGSDANRSSRPNQFTRAGERCVFAANGPDNDRAPWTSDGTRDGTRELVDLGLGSSAFDSPQLRGSSQDAWILDTIRSTSIRHTDGTSTGTHIAFDFGPGYRLPLPYGQMAALGESLLIPGQFDGFEGLQRIDRDGTLTTLISGRIDLASFLIHGNHAWIALARPQLGSALWVTDGTVAGTIELPGVQPDPSFAPVAFAGRLWLPGDLGGQAWDARGLESFPQLRGRTLLAVGERLWSVGHPLGITDGTLAGTTQVLLPLAPDWRSPAAALSDRALYFDRNDHPCVTDGTAAGTIQLSVSIRRTSASAGFVVLSPERAVFGALADDGNYETLYVTDGTVAGTHRITDLEAGEPALVNGLLYFAGVSPEFGEEPFVADPGPVVETVGSPCTTVPLRDVILRVDREPVLGETLQVTGRATDARAAFLLLGLPLDRSLRLDDLHCFLHVDLFAAMDLGPLLTDARGAFQLELPIPDDPALLGEAVMLQCLFASGTPTSLDVSQGLRLKLGR